MDCINLPSLVLPSWEMVKVRFFSAAAYTVVLIVGCNLLAKRLDGEGIM